MATEAAESASAPSRARPSRPLASLERRAAVGVAWTSAARLSQQAIQLLVTVVLARFVRPEEFGLVAMVGLVTGFASILVEFGLGAALVQRRECTDAHLSGAFWLSVLVALVATSMLWAGAPLVAALFHSPRLLPIARGLSPVFVLSAAGIVPRAIFQTRIAFGKLARLDLVAALASGSVATVLAVRGWGVWSLVVQSLVLAGVTSALLLTSSGWRPQMRVERAAIRDLTRYSAYLTGFSAVNYWARHVDDLLIGRIMGPLSLGLYDRAYALMLIPATQLAGMANPVMLPVLAAVQDDHAHVRALYLRYSGMVAFAAIPLLAGLGVTAEPFVLAVFGPAWRAAIPVVRILSLVGIIQAVCSPVGWIYTSQGRTDLLARWGVLASGTYVAAILIGIRLGSLEAVAWSYLAANALLMLPCLYLPARLIELPLPHLLRTIVAPLAGSAVMAIGVAAVAGLLPSGLGLSARLLVEVAAGAGLYGGMALLSRSPALADLRRFASLSRRVVQAR